MFNLPAYQINIEMRLLCGLAMITIINNAFTFLVSFKPFTAFDTPDQPSGSEHSLLFGFLSSDLMLSFQVAPSLQLLRDLTEFVLLGLTSLVLLLANLYLLSFSQYIQYLTVYFNMEVL